MTKRIGMFCALALVILMTGACTKGGSPTSPSDPSYQALSVSPDGLSLGLGQTQTYTVLGGNCAKYEWSLPKGGGVITPQASSSRATLTVDADPGTYPIHVTCGSDSKEAQFKAISLENRENSVTILSVSPEQGNTSPIRLVTVVFDYTTAVDGMKAAVFLRDENKKLVGGSSSISLNASGRATLQASGAPGTSFYFNIQFYIEGQGTVQEFEFPMKYLWG